MPADKYLFSLQDLCIVASAKNIDRLCAPYYKRWHRLSELRRPQKGPLAKIATHYVIAIFEQVKELGKLRSRHLRFFVSEDSTKFEITTTPKMSADAVITFLSARCPNLVELVLRAHPQSMLEYGIINTNKITPELIIPAIIDWKRLRIIHLSNYNVNDDIVVMIATHCSRLRSLNLRATNVTDEGLYALKLGDRNHLLKKDFIVRSEVEYSLQYLDITETKATSKCVAELAKLPRLTTLLSDCLLEALVDIWREMEKSKKSMDEVPILHFSAIFQVFPERFLPPVRDLYPLSEEDILASIKMCKRAKNLVLNVMPNHLLNHLKLFTRMNLTKLDLSCKEYLKEGSFGQLRPLLEEKGDMLTHLKLENFAQVDLYFLGNKCPYVNHLVLLSNTFTRATMNWGHFRRLITLNVSSCRVLSASLFSLRVNEVREMNQANIVLFFTRPNLVTLKLSHQTGLTDEVCAQITARSRLRSLRSLFLISCNKVTVRGIRQLIALNNTMQKLEMMNCKSLLVKDYKKLKKLVRENNLDMEINGVYNFFRHGIVKY